MLRVVWIGFLSTFLRLERPTSSGSDERWRSRGRGDRMSVAFRSSSTGLGPGCGWIDGCHPLGLNSRSSFRRDDRSGCFVM